MRSETSTSDGVKQAAYYEPLGVDSAVHPRFLQLCEGRQLRGGGDGREGILVVELWVSRGGRISSVLRHKLIRDKGQPRCSKQLRRDAVRWFTVQSHRVHLSKRV